MEWWFEKTFSRYKNIEYPPNNLSMKLSLARKIIVRTSVFVVYVYICVKAAIPGF